MMQEDLKKLIDCMFAHGGNFGGNEDADAVIGQLRANPDAVSDEDAERVSLLTFGYFYQDGTGQTWVENVDDLWTCIKQAFGLDAGTAQPDCIALPIQLAVAILRLT